MSRLVIDAVSAEIDRVRADQDFIARARQGLVRDEELLERLEKS